MDKNKKNIKIEKIVGEMLLKKKLTVSIAESCTGGLISSRLTDIQGSSAFIKLNLITYANEAKIEMLGVSPQTIEKFGAVSEQTVFEMAKGAKNIFKAAIGMGITGIAGPTGETPNKPIGLVYIGISNEEITKILKINANPKWERTKIKYFASEKALEFLKEFIEENY